MKPEMQLALPLTSNRRAFFKKLGALGIASSLCGRSVMGGAARYAQRFQLFVDAPVPDFNLAWPTPQFPPLPDGAIVRTRFEFPIAGQDILEWETSVDFTPTLSAVVTLFHLRVDKINLSAVPTPSFGLFGQIIDNPIVDNPAHSPFGDLTGLVAMVSAGFDAPGADTTFTLLGGAGAGNHAVALRTATGALHIQGPWHSF